MLLIAVRARSSPFAHLMLAGVGFEATGSKGCASDGAGTWPRANLPCPLLPTVRAFGSPALRHGLSMPPPCGLGGHTSLVCVEPTMPSADCCRSVSADRSPSGPLDLDNRPISQGKTRNVPRVDAGLIKPTSGNGGLHGHVPARPGLATPLLRFLCMAPHV